MDNVRSNADPVPAGEHHAELLYRAPGFTPGLLLAALALVGSIARVIPPPAEDFHTPSGGRVARQSS